MQFATHYNIMNPINVSNNSTLMCRNLLTKVTNEYILTRHYWIQFENNTLFFIKPKLATNTMIFLIYSNFTFNRLFLTIRICIALEQQWQIKEEYFSLLYQQ